MPVFRVNCHNCWRKPVIIDDKAPIFCPHCGNVMKKHIENITLNEEESYQNLLKKVLK